MRLSNTSAGCRAAQLSTRAAVRGRADWDPPASGRVRGVSERATAASIATRPLGEPGLPPAEPAEEGNGAAAGEPLHAVRRPPSPCCLPQRGRPAVPAELRRRWA
jgi:hypothetical protein